MSLQFARRVNSETAVEPNVQAFEPGLNWLTTAGAEVPSSTSASPWRAANTQAPVDNKAIDEEYPAIRVDAEYLLAGVIQLLQSNFTQLQGSLTGNFIESIHRGHALVGIEDGDRWLKAYEALEAYGSTNSDLRDALSDLGEVTIEAQEEDYPAPSREALTNADSILRRMYRISPQRFEVYPMPNGAIAIDAAYSPGNSLVVLCASDGNASCLVNINGKPRKALYSDAGQLPDEFVRKALQELAYRRNLAK